MTMHETSFFKAQCFVENYSNKIKNSGENLSVLEIGSKSYHDHDTFRSLFPDSKFKYVGLDISEGNNVDIVPRKGYVWEEIDDDKFDFVISGQTFEHNPFYWVTFCEMTRVLKPGGFMFVIAPGGGPVHRYPYDCWRFYPDSWRALTTLTGMSLVESYYERDTLAPRVAGGEWRDSAVIAQKPVLSQQDGAALNARLEALVTPYAGMPFELDPESEIRGEAFAMYERLAVERVGHPRWKKRLRARLIDLFRFAQPITRD